MGPRRVLSLSCWQSLIQRSYRDDISSSAIERFLPLILDYEEEGVAVTPCFTSNGINYLHIRHNNLYRTLNTLSSLSLSRSPRSHGTRPAAHHHAPRVDLHSRTVVALTKKNSNAAEILTFLHKLVSVRRAP